MELPRDSLLGEEGHGYKYAIGLLNEGRIGIAAQMTGLALGAWENAAKYVWNDRKQFGHLVHMEIRSLSEVVSLLRPFLLLSLQPSIHDSIIQLLFILVFYRYICFNYISTNNVNFHIRVSCSQGQHRQ
jgi:hypothetical protein